MCVAEPLLSAHGGKSGPLLSPRRSPSRSNLSPRSLLSVCSPTSDKERRRVHSPRHRIGSAKIHLEKPESVRHDTSKLTAMMYRKQYDKLTDNLTFARKKAKQDAKTIENLQNALADIRW